jgi:RNA polymerase sigma factor (sigma-70 family)
MEDLSSILCFFNMIPSPELLERCRKDDRKAHYELYSQCFSFLLSVCRRYYINREDMESSLNQIYVKMVKNISTYLNKSEQVPFELWARRIAINHIIDEFRRNRKHRENLDYREIHDAEDLHPVMHPDFDSEKLEEILDAIKKLPEVNRAVFNLFVVDGYKHEEIAKMLSISTGTSKAHLHRARKKLRELLENEWKKKRMIHNIVLQ